MQQQLFEWKKSFLVNWVQFCPHWEFGQLETEADLQQLACDFVVFGICKYFQVAPFVHCRQFGQPLKIFDKALFDKDFSCCNISVNMVFIMFLTWSNPHYQNIFLEFRNYYRPAWHTTFQNQGIHQFCNSFNFVQKASDTAPPPSF